MDYIARNSMLLRQGRHVADLASSMVRRRA
ncbi:hypothetical protein [Novosphingobium sp. KACC 22771]